MPPLAKPLAGGMRSPGYVEIITCGGTFDTCTGSNGRVFYVPSIVNFILDRHRARANTLVNEIMQIDSSDMDDRLRELLADKVSSSDANRLVIVHGTDTLALSSQVIARLELPKTVVFTGAFVPADQHVSDGPANLMAALTAARLLTAGVYLSIHGDLFPAGKFHKDEREGSFKCR